MELTPREKDKLLLFTAALLAPGRWMRRPVNAATKLAAAPSGRYSKPAQNTSADFELALQPSKELPSK